MIKDKSHIITRVSAIAIALCFLLPVAISTLHAAQAHDHSDRCAYSGETHMHESQLDCDLGDLHVVKVDFYAFAKAYTVLELQFFKVNNFKNRSLYTRNLESTKSRGPPVC